MSGLSQADAYRQFRPPTILIGDSRLGGISTTLASYEALLIRGYSIEAVLLFHDAYYNNHEYLANHFARNAKGTLVQTIPRPPCRPFDVPDESQDEAAMEAYYASICDSPPPLPDSASIPQNVSGIGAIPAILSHIKCRHNERITNIASMPERTLSSVWWPFVQHANIPGARESHGGVTVIDSAFGDFLEASGPGSPSPSAASVINTGAVRLKTPKDNNNPTRTPLLGRQFDGSASWWTQAIGHANSQLTLAAAHAAGRYGHVIFPLATHEPALALAERLLAKDGSGEGWAHKVFFSDDGSTGMEVALKMAIRASALRYPTPSLPSPSEKRELHILGISGSYHGDTIGTMDACEGGVYNSAVEWHRERGFWFDPPRVGVRDGGQVTVSIPAASWAFDLDLQDTETEFAKWTGGRLAAHGDDRVGSSAALTTTVKRGDDRTLRVGFSGGPLPDVLQYVYDVPQRFAQSDPLITLYTKYITAVLERLVVQEKRTFGALLLEPILMGAGGMVWVDPLFQRVLIDVVRAREDLWSHISGNIIKSDVTQESSSSWCGLPVIFDEVFVGLYRLGFLSSSSILGTFPDISVLAKILTGGLVPMSVTLASNSIYDAFLGPEKKDALLHGHSYTAHPIGCAVAGKTLDIIQEFSSGGGDCGQDWTNAKVRWMATPPTLPLSESASASHQPTPRSQDSSQKEGIWSLWDSDFVAALSRCPAVDEVMSLGTVLAIQLRGDAAAGMFPF